MKYRLKCMALVVLLLFSVVGCTSESGKEQTLENQMGAPVKNAPSLPTGMISAGWPANLVPSELPEYTGGVVVNSGEDSGTVYIKIKDTDQETLGKYLSKLKSAGWIVTGDSSEAEAVKDLNTVNFNWQGGGTMLQMALYTGKAGQWPSDQIPPDIPPPHIGNIVEEVEILETTEDAWYFNYTYDGVDEASARQYMESLLEKGWSGDNSMVNKTFQWNGKKYSADIEIYETLEDRTTFTCNFYIVE